MLQVLGRVRRLLSVQEPPDLRIPQATFKRHSSDATGSFFPDLRYSIGRRAAATGQYVFSDIHLILFRVNPGPDEVPPPLVDALSTLREVNSNLPSPESSPSAVFPRLVISPPVTSDDCYTGDFSGNGAAPKPQNRPEPPPTEVTPGSENSR